MPKNPSSPATKDDIRLVMEMIGRLYDANASWKDEIIAEIEKRIGLSAERTHHEFRVVAEQIRHDFRGAFHDKLEQHEDRLIRLEISAGIRAS